MDTPRPVVLIDPFLGFLQRKMVGFRFSAENVTELILMRWEIGSVTFLTRHGVLRYPGAIIFALKRFALNKIVLVRNAVRHLGIIPRVHCALFSA